jgi:hypothetical protein
MWSILIDSVKREITKYKLDCDDFPHHHNGLNEAIHKAIECETFCEYRFKNHILVLDDNGLYNAKGMFTFGDDHPLTNKALIFDAWRDDYKPTSLTKTDVEDLVAWINPAAVPGIAAHLLGSICVVPIERPEWFDQL